MSEHIQIGDISPRIQYSGDGSTAVFAYPFPIFTDSDLDVYIGDTLQVTGYTIAGAGASSGGTVTFDIAPINGSTLTLRRYLAVERTTDFQESGEFRAKVINDELDREIAMIQQISDDLNRTIHLAAFDETTPLELPEKSLRADRVLAFDANGSPIASTNSLSSIEDSITLASASATAAAVSETNAAVSETNAGNSEAAAAASAATIPAYDDLAGEALSYVRLNTGETGMEFRTASETQADLGLVVNTNVQAFDADTTKNDANNTFTKAQRGSITALIDGTIITPDLANNNHFSVTLAGNRLLANPTNLVAGQSGSLIIMQDATGSRTLSFGSYWKFAGGTAPSLTTAAAAIDRIDYFVKSATEIHAVLTGDNK